MKTKDKINAEEAEIVKEIEEAGLDMPKIS